MSGPGPSGELLLLFDPAFTLAGQEAVPEHVVLGAWLLDGTGMPSRFHPNPHYRPGSPDSPLDPVDAVLRALSAGEDVADRLPVVLRDTVLGIATAEDGTALVRPAPDGVPSVQVATSPGHRAGAPAAARWLDVTVEELAAALPPHGVDVLLNPGSVASMRLLADVVRALARPA
ncbi:type VII secretion system-associated protein [Amycolatopsis sp. Hca4]|uniref:type VII secretion system-associated protein n=1 Tax=Amycolatopsis sp. Hca4 TaxID=2742131 RepID=UPI001590B813|nr:type VII secretion system-associated protein [Amycolatopsis sp. Hca4]QKV74014.1 type VII secretion system-associated protein [Amycolatopsis sp. Hca4]